MAKPWKVKNKPTFRKQREPWRDELIEVSDSELEKEFFIRIHEIRHSCYLVGYHLRRFKLPWSISEYYTLRAESDLLEYFLYETTENKRHHPNLLLYDNILLKITTSMAHVVSEMERYEDWVFEEVPSRKLRVKLMSFSEAITIIHTGITSSRFSLEW